MSTIENRFNLVDEPWVPVAGEGLVSLKSIFTRPELRALGGNPVQKIAMTKLLLAICQAAYTPKDDADWANLGAEGMSKKAAKYLEEKRDCFWLYGERPFLQMRELEKIWEDQRSTALASIEKEAVRKKMEEKYQLPLLGNGDTPDLPADNNTVLTQRESSSIISDAEKALFLITIQNFALAGKQIDAKIVIQPEYTIKSAVAKVGPSLGRACFLHSYVLGNNLTNSIYINLLTEEQVNNMVVWQSGVGHPIWEKMPTGEDCEISKLSKQTLQGALVPLCRFMLFCNERLLFTEGIQYPNHKAGWVEPFVSYQRAEEIKVLQAQTSKKPWRDLTAILSYIFTGDGYDSLLLRIGLDRIKRKPSEDFSIWSGGLDASGDAFGQKIKATDDYVESEISLNSDQLGELWFSKLKSEMMELDTIADTTLKRAVYFYNKREIKDSKERDKRADTLAKEAINLFWQLAERKFQDLVNACGSQTPEPDVALKPIRKIFAGFAETAYNTYCPRESARQLDAWAANRPNLGKYLSSI